MGGVYQAGRFAVPVLYEDNHLLAVVKPANMPVMADASGDLDLLTALKQYIAEAYHKPGAVYLGLVHRLDRPVGGVMVFARTSKAASRLSQAFAAHETEKRYLAVVEGDLTGPRELTDCLLKDERTGMVRVVPPDAPGAKEARLLTAPLARRQGTTLCEVRLYTGRAHQIRVQHAHAGLPLWGDNRYGRGRPGEQIALFARQLTVPHPTRREPMTFSALPGGGAFDWYRDVLEALS